MSAGASRLMEQGAASIAACTARVSLVPMSIESMLLTEECKAHACFCSQRSRARSEKRSLRPILCVNGHR